MTNKSPLTAAERQRQYEQDRKAAGWRRVALWLAPRVDRAVVRAYVDRKNKDALKKGESHD